MRIFFCMFMLSSFHSKLFKYIVRPRIQKSAGVVVVSLPSLCDTFDRLQCPLNDNRLLRLAAGIFFCIHS